jgi:hypothetical protein
MSSLNPTPDNAPMPDSAPRLLYTDCVIQGHFSDGSSSNKCLAIRFKNFSITGTDGAVILFGQAVIDTPDVA